MSHEFPTDRGSSSLEHAFDSPEAKLSHNRALFSSIAARYDLITRDSVVRPRSALERPRLIELASVQRGDVVVDLACGTGDLAFLSAARGASVTGLDLTPRMIEIARVRPEAADTAGAVDSRRHDAPALWHRDGRCRDDRLRASKRAGTPSGAVRDTSRPETRRAAVCAGLQPARELRSCEASTCVPQHRRRCAWMDPPSRSRDLSIHSSFDSPISWRARRRRSHESRGFRGRSTHSCLRRFHGDSHRVKTTVPDTHGDD